jgi:hypothetical protein
MGMRSLQRALLPAPVKIAFAGLGGRHHPNMPPWLRMVGCSPLSKPSHHGPELDHRTKDGGDIPEEAVEGLSGHGSRPQDGESAAPKRSGFGSLGQIRVFQRDVPES